MEDKTLNFVSYIVIGLILITIGSVWIGNVSDKRIGEQTVYPISQEFDGYTMHFKNQTDYLRYFLGDKYVSTLP
jgi:hypothetical protein